MEDEATWHARAVERLGQIFGQDADVRAFVLSGSLATVKVRTDVWSDVDAKIILADHALDRYYQSTAWLDAFGRLIGAERHQNPFTKTLRVCLEGFQRFDLTFMAESILQNPSLWDRNPFHPSYLVVWSRLPDLETLIASLPIPTGYQDVPNEEIERMINEFWFKASLAVVRIARNDLLIGLHLALDLARDTLVLQMIRRDREKRTTIHRTGGWGNEFVAGLAWNGQVASGEEILNVIQLNCRVLDELASEMVSGYNQRGPLLFPSIESAKQICSARIKPGKQATSTK